MPVSGRWRGPSIDPLLPFEPLEAMSVMQRLPLLVAATLPNGHRPIPAIRALTRGTAQ